MCLLSVLHIGRVLSDTSLHALGRGGCEQGMDAAHRKVFPGSVHPPTHQCTNALMFSFFAA